jgi:hypothetical protein
MQLSFDMLSTEAQREYVRLRNLIPEDLEAKEVMKLAKAGIFATITSGASVPISICAWRFGKLYKARTSLNDLEEFLHGQLRVHDCDGIQLDPAGFPSLPTLVEYRFS